MDWLTPEKATIYAVLIIALIAFVKRWIVTGKQLETEKALLKEGHAKETAAYDKVIAYKDEQIVDLRGQLNEANKVNVRREKQLHLVLSEIAPSMVAWSNSMQTVAMEITDGGSGDGDLPS